MTKEDFVKAYAPANMWRYAVQEEKCHIGNGHTIAQAVQEFGISSVHEVFTSLLLDFVKFNHSNQVITSEQLNEIAAAIVCEFRYLKVTELVLFFAKAKAGRFGKFFNSIYPMDITTQLCEWERVCNQRKGELFHARHLAELAEEKAKWEEESRVAASGAVWVSKHGQKHMLFERSEERGVDYDY